MTDTTFPPNSENQPPATGQTPPTVEQLQAEIDKWKSLSRTNEKRWNDASGELETLRQERMTEAEKATEKVRAATRSAVLAEIAPQLVEAAIASEAAKSGIEVGDLQFTPLEQFIGEDGTVNRELVIKFVQSRGEGKPVYAQNLGLGRQGGTTAGQLSRGDLARMTPKEIQEARKAGLLDALMRGAL
ncbi:hypothetical protein ACFC1T_08345 [Kitasatospora sp. NPDC056076]|uniref:hypothetical protein n=1 Tax=Kitasatospora sp. NPDC056076 TaxID=3345703 RepID=UPI0035D81855